SMPVFGTLFHRLGSSALMCVCLHAVSCQGLLFFSRSFLFFFFIFTASPEIYTLSYTTLFRSPSRARRGSRCGCASACRRSGRFAWAYQLAFTMPGTSPLSASSRKHRRHISNFRRYARGRPHSLHRWYARVENFGVRCDFMMRAVFAIRLLLPERHAEVRQERLRVLVRPRRRDDDDVHPANLVD